MGKLICCRCKNEKEEEDFSFKNKPQNIRNKTCKACFVSVRRQWYLNHRQSIIDKNTANKKKNITWFEKYKKKLKCSKCTETHFACLDFHHLDPDKKDFNISKLINSTYSIETTLKEIDKCIILCSNCHRKLHYEMKNAPVVQLDQSVTFLK